MADFAILEALDEADSTLQGIDSTLWVTLVAHEDIGLGDGGQDILRLVRNEIAAVRAQIDTAVCMVTAAKEEQETADLIRKAQLAPVLSLHPDDGPSNKEALEDGSAKYDE